MEKRFDDKELMKLRAWFFEKDDIKLLRKAFLPELTQNAPIAGNETLLSYIKTEGLSNEEVAIETKATMKMIRHIESVLNMLEAVVANQSEDAATIASNIKKNQLK